MCILFEFVGCHFRQSFFDFERRLALGETGSIRDAKNMCIDGNGGFTESRIKDHVGGFSANSGESLKIVTRVRYFAVMLFNEHAAGLNDVFGFAVEESNGPYVRLQFSDTKSKYRLGCASDGIQFVGRFVDADVGCLRGQDYSNE